MSDTKERKVFLFKLEDGSTNWLGAHNAFDAVLLYMEQTGFKSEDFDCPDDLEVNIVDEAEGRHTSFIDMDADMVDGSYPRRPMWDEFQRDPSRRFIASSEW